ncbi:kelch-like protein 24 [Glandiceps talaboti]
MADRQESLTMATKSSVDTPSELRPASGDRNNKLENVGLTIDKDKQTAMLQHPDHAGEILQNLNELRQSRDFTDITICVERDTFPCHRAVLAASCLYFKAMFKNDLRERQQDRVTLTGLKSAIIKNLLDYSYTSKLLITVDNAQDLLSTAQFLQYEPVVHACCEFLKTQIHPSNCLGIESFAETHSCFNLAAEARSCALANLVDVVKQSEFLELSAERLISYVSDDSLNVNTEEMVYVAVMAWVRHDVESRWSELPAVLQNVRLPLISPGFLLNHIESDPLIEHCKDSRNLIERAKTIQETVWQGTDMRDPSLKPRPSMMTEVMVVVGGINSQRQWMRDVTFYNPIEKKWDSLPALPFPQTDYSVTALSNNIYITGGYENDDAVHDVWCYESETNIWNLIAPMHHARFNHGSTSTDGRVYVVGGENDEGDLQDIEGYHPLEDKWDCLGSIYPTESNLAVTGIKRNLFIVGWLTYEKTCAIQCYNLDTQDCWVTNTVELNRHLFPIISLNNHVYILGGNRIKDVQVYDPERDHEWKVADMISKRNHPSAAVVDRKIYVSGGELRHYSDKIEMYDPAMDCWTAVTPMPKALCFHGFVSIHKYIGPPYL